MRILFITMNIVLISLTVFLSLIHLRYKGVEFDKELQETPVSANIKAVGIFDGKSPAIPEISELYDNNLFHPNRGRNDVDAASSLSSPPMVKPQSLELVGICEFGDIKGAIILDNNSAPKTGFAHVSQYYKIGATLSNGYKLMSINNDSVVLAYGSNQFTLKLEHGDKGSTARNAAVPPPQPVAATTVQKVTFLPKNDVPPKVPESKVLETFKKKYPDRYERYMKRLNQNGEKRESVRQPSPPPS